MFDEFAGKHKEHLGTGDVKNHMGFSSDFQTDGGLVHLALAFNPSHLEIVSPVVIGSVVPVWTDLMSRAATKCCQSPSTVTPQ
ncbi:hypothetical protein ACNKHR_03305 [Shigella flexneri]